MQTRGFGSGVAALLLVTLTSTAAGGPFRNGFDLEHTAMHEREFLRGGPPRDGIRALDAPKTLLAKDAPWSDETMVLGVALGDEARAYPIPILNWHELVNDTLGGRSILVSFCPLCGTGLVFDREVGGAVRSFGVSGLLYLSDLLLYDRESESLWSQISAKAVSGPALGTRLRVLRSAMIPWAAWRERHPKTRVLSPDTGFERPYNTNPYGEYATSEQVMFPVPGNDRYHPKMPTLGIRIPQGAARAYPAIELQKAGGSVSDSFEGHAVRVSYDAEKQIFDVEVPSELEVVEGFWFAWAAFHPATTVFRAQE